MVTKVYMICFAYESGFGHGFDGKLYDNPYPKDVEQYEAYDIGQKEGLKRREEQKRRLAEIDKGRMVPRQSLVQHKKGGIYNVITYGKLEWNQQQVAIYEELYTEDKIWVRPIEEFEDGRFKVFNQ